MDVRIPPLKIKILLESNPPKSRILVGRLAVSRRRRPPRRPPRSHGTPSETAPPVPVAQGRQEGRRREGEPRSLSLSLPLSLSLSLSLWA